MNAPDTNPTCPCGSGLSFAQCCGRYIDAGESAPSAEALMRSRYTAFVRADATYLLRTWHPSTRPLELDLGDTNLRWLGLSIKRCKRGGPDDAEGMVEFVARMKRGGRAARLHEVSRFTREDGQWFYVDGELREPHRR